MYAHMFNMGTRMTVYECVYEFCVRCMVNSSFSVIFFDHELINKMTNANVT